MKLQGGLTPTPPDERDFQLGAITTLPELETLPTDFRLPFTVKDQGDSDFCSAYMSCAMSEPQEGVHLEPSYSFALSKALTGDPDAWGQNLRDALRAHVKFGALPETEAPFSIATKGADFLRRLDNWPIDQNRAYPYRKRTFFKITGPYDHFDNARAALFKFKSPIGFGVNFGWKPKTVILNTIPTSGYGHAVTVVGFSQLETGEPSLVILNSYGEDAGDNGVHYMTRQVYNHFVDGYGHYMFTDISKEDAQYRLDNGITLEDNWLTALLKAFATFIRNIVSIR